MRPSTIAKIVAALVLVLVVAVIAAGKSLKSEAYNQFLAERVKAASGLDLSFAGPTKLKLGPSPVLSFTGVTLSAGQGADLLYIDRVEARIALVPLALRQLRLETLSLIRPVLHAGTLDRLAAAKPVNLADSPAGVFLTRPSLGEVLIEDAAIRLTGTTIQVTKAQVRPESEAGGPLSLQLSGRWQDSRFDVSGVVGPLSALTGGTKPYPLQIKGSVGGANLSLRGTMAAPLAGKGLDLDFRTQGEELADLLRLRPGKPPAQTFGPFKLAARITDAAGPIALADIDAVIGRRESQLITAKGQMADALNRAGIDMTVSLEAESLSGMMRLLDLDLPNVGPVKLSGRLADIENGWRLTGLKSSLGKSDLAGEASLVLAPRPRLYGRLAAAQMNPADFTLPPSRGSSAQSSQPQRPAIPIDDGRILGVEPLALDLIKDMDATLSLAATRLQWGPATLSDATGELRMAAGRLSLEAFSARAGEGQLAGEARLDAAAKTPALALRLAGSGVDPAALTGGALKGGKADFTLDLKAQGGNPRAMAGTAEGSLALTLGETLLARNSGGELPARLARDIDAGALGADGLRLRCLVARLPVKAGLISIDRGLAAETAGSGAMAAGSIDLRTEALDIAVTSRSAPLLRVKGVLGAPVVTADSRAKAHAEANPCRAAQARRLTR
ncbi:hypothetical protein H261_05954 [Paramagnetospirillum caucaseum]|uniref:AsmA domain-containing protein n=1 Tax=Paramagnetospirillum caucaseum TaxID=1244869 RepID=M3AEF4_9PROT|nr:AsmA family protein [Paramagnetospirillum caucaseum]EME70929.1 hypothetical protein H261_05954 [Paramagnetospirillum caucaseum]